jgi:hypothetical protein
MPTTPTFSSSTAPAMIETTRSIRGDEMSVSSISSSSLIPSSNQNPHNNLRKFQSEFQQLRSDLQTGTSAPPSGSPIAQTFKQLGQALQSGSVSATQQDNTQLQTNFQKAEHTHGHHHHPVRDPLETTQGNDQSGQAVQSGDVSSVPAAYNSALQDFQHFGQGTAASLTPDLSALSSNSISVSA